MSYQLVIDCASPDALAHFWAEALHCVVAPPPDGFESWDDFFRSIGVPEDELGDVNASGGRQHPLDIRRERVEAEATRLESVGATRIRTMSEEGLDHYAVATTDSEGQRVRRAPGMRQAWLTIGPPVPGEALGTLAGSVA